MKRHAIRYTEAARADLMSLGDHLKDRAGESVARAFIDRLLVTIETLSRMPERHRLRTELSPNVRAIGFRRYLIFYVVENDAVVVVRVLHGSRDITENCSRAESAPLSSPRRWSSRGWCSCRPSPRLSSSGSSRGSIVTVGGSSG